MKRPQLMAVPLDDDTSVDEQQAGLTGIELEGQPSKVSVREVWWEEGAVGTLVPFDSLRGHRYGKCGGLSAAA